MMDSFTFPGLTTRVVFGAGSMARVEEEVRRLGHDKVMVLSTSHQKGDAERLAASLGGLAAGIFAGAVMHTPVEVTEKAVDAFRSSGASAVVSLGGGSTTGLGKAIAVRTGADQVVIPTTYAGSEMTDILGETAAGEKTTRRSPDIRPETVIYDVDLTLSLPVGLTVTSAMNAIAHAMEAFYAPDRNPVIVLMCRDAMIAFKDGIPRLIGDPQDRAARTQALYAAWCCSTALGYVSMALHHKLAHVFGGSFDTPHAETHAILLPYTTAFNEAAVPDLLRPIAEAFGGGSAGGGLWDFAQSVGSPLSLKAIGIEETDLDRAAAIAVKNAYANPRPIDPGSIRELLQVAWEGRRPGA
ncbi:maleylacetate reductase [Mesorhizobium sp. M7A.F.Ca.CA.001.07.2.1]|uniref:maleylacetate reductase n=3 Tax=Phyllobacteriaceae TaxID=69277 RepID=UPI000FCB6F75|nr:maleylacetate reductase [Mesorhizobium sp. M7A.F.Ca.CA.004.08.2.1]RUX89657.1 maleylacetate reductase [Mesorhizobium sp. M7A.F.Ca.CA.004.08.1.1]RUY02317.1 maleylacetate reductase [Mesorhizobium sp. M7A.F.Ca.CA.004.04.1.1]RUY59056.1 maleylacetate reductase [Mesorhizobium sp. M7A.F.Ca.CA.001.12.1.1]RUZ57114.1 maleylacetate reductase [Mesorhizobium sp. M7A.F.Ca.CA.004.05.2.1]RUZ96148.1 maleylacetate reductase [Mesorhizobium sp. M7A.F.Ca.US.006.01.2.1]RVA20327.1 maleylacetate reductase [Mesorhi